jgi:hypothetical protein
MGKNNRTFLLIITLIVLIWLPHSMYAQEPEAYVSTDTFETPPPKAPGTFSILFHGNPGKALTYSLILPGAGQIYNRRYWKAPLVWGGMGAFIYYIDRYTKQERRFIEEIERRVNGDTLDFEFYSVDALRQFRDITNTNKQYSYIGLGALYLLQAIEAFVDRHLMEFDVNENLSIRLRPGGASVPLGMTVVLSFP